MKARTYRQSLPTGLWQYVIITERWYCEKMREYDYIGVAVLGSTVHEFQVSVKQVNQMIKNGSMRLIEVI